MNRISWKDMAFIILISTVMSTLLTLGITNYILNPREPEPSTWFEQGVPDKPGATSVTDFRLEQALRELEAATQSSIFRINSEYPGVIVGPMGPQGIPGPAGQDGQRGERGSQGVQGIEGPACNLTHVGEEIPGDEQVTPTPEPNPEPEEEYDVKIYWDSIRDSPTRLKRRGKRDADKLTLSQYSGYAGDKILVYGGVLSPYAYEITVPDLPGSHWVWAVDSDGETSEMSKEFIIE